jgi:hypothetical protein
MTTPESPDTIHAIVSPTLKQSVREFCAKHDCRESQLVRRAIQAILSGKVSAQ